MATDHTSARCVWPAMSNQSCSSSKLSHDVHGNTNLCAMRHREGQSHMFSLVPWRYRTCACFARRLASLQHLAHDVVGIIPLRFHGAPDLLFCDCSLPLLNGMLLELAM